MSKPKITGSKSADSGFSVTFPNGFDEDPCFEITGLEINCDGEDLLYGSLMACSNYILSQIDAMKSKPQCYFNLEDLKGGDGNLNCRIKDGEILKP